MRSQSEVHRGLLMIVRQHADKIEDVLPQEARRGFRRALARLRPANGRKPHDDHDLLWAIAEAELDAVGCTRDTRALVTEFVNRFSMKRGADMEGRRHVILPDGSRPNRRDLINRLSKKYEAEGEVYRRRVALEREEDLRMAKLREVFNVLFKNERSGEWMPVFLRKATCDAEG